MFHGGNSCYPDFESITDLGRAAGAMICEDKSSWQDRISWKSYGCFEAARRTAHLNHDGSQEPTMLVRKGRALASCSSEYFSLNPTIESVTVQSYTDRRKNARDFVYHGEAGR